MRELILWRVDKEPRVLNEEGVLKPLRRKGSGVLKEEKMTDIVLLTFLSLSHISQTSLYFL